MRISGWHVEGFGILHQFEVADLPPGLCLISGSNEAGKSTLLDFIRGVLFGYPTTRGSKRYPPLRGGRHGGRVMLQPSSDQAQPGAAGAIIVERFAGPRQPFQLTLADGTPGSESDLRRTLGGADRQLFNSVFAFDLEELSSADFITEEEIRDRVFSAGILGAGHSARAVIKTLQARNDELYRPKAVCRIGTLLPELENQLKLCVSAQAQAQQYPLLLQRVKEAQDHIASVKDSLRNIELSGRRFRMLIELWPVYYEEQQVRQQLDLLGVVAELPSGTDRRFAECLEQKKSAEQERSQHQAELEELDQRITSLTQQLDQRLAPIIDAVEDACRVSALQQSRLSRRLQLSLEVRQTASESADCLQKLGPSWNEELLRTAGVSLAVREDVRSWQEKLDRAAAEVQQGQSPLKEVNARLRLKEQEITELKNRAAELPSIDQELLSKEESAAKELLLKLPHLALLEDKISSRKQLMDQFIEEQHRPAAGRKQLRSFFSVTAFLSALLLLAASTAGLVSASTALAFVLGLLIMGLAYLAASWRQTTKKCPAASEQTQGLQLFEIQAQQLRRDIEGCRDTLALSPEITLAEAQQRAAELAALRRSHDRRSELSEQLQSLEREVITLQDSSVQLTQQHDHAQRRLEQCGRQWVSWKTSHLVPESFSAPGVLEFFSLLEKARNALQLNDRKQRELQELCGEIREWEERASALLESAGEQVKSGSAEAILNQLEALHKRIQDFKEAGAECGRARQQWVQLEQRIAAIDSRLSASAAALKQLYISAGVDNEDAFESLLERHYQAAVLSRAAADRQAEISRRIGTGDKAELFLAELGQGSVELWESELKDCEELRLSAEEEIIAAQRDLFAAEQERERLENSSDLSALATDQQTLSTELEELCRQWLVQELAKALVQETLVRYSRTRQPAVLAEASRWFSMVTGVYDRIIQDEEGMSIAVLDQRGEKKLPEQLSRGTLEQLYLCLRLGLAAEFAKRSCALPLIIDDVMVNFDLERAQAMARALIEFSKSQQVLFFTCHPWTVEIFGQICPQLRLIELAEQ